MSTMAAKTIVLEAVGLLCLCMSMVVAIAPGMTLLDVTALFESSLV